MIKSITRFVTLAALFLIPIFPLIVANSYFFPFITGKAFYFRILVEIAFLGWLVLAFADARYRPKINGMMIGVSVLALVALVADLVGVNPIRSLWSNFERMEGWITIAHLWMFYIATVGVFSFTSGSSPTEEAKRWWQRWMNAFLVIGFIVGCYGFAQLFGWTAIHQGSSRIDASLGNAAYMAVYMLMNIGFALYLFFVAREKSNSKPLQWLYGVLAVIFAFLLFETATRGTIIGLVGGTMLTLFLYAILAKSSSKKSRMICGGIVAFLVIAVIGIYALRSQPLIKNNDVLNRLTSISLSNSESTARLQIWGMALQGVKVRPILGWGQENFNYIFNYYYNPHMWMQEQWFDRAHSVFLDWLTASGIVGLLAYLALYVLAFMGVWKSDLSIAKKCVLIGFIAAYAIHNIFVFDNLASYVGFFAVLGFVGSGLTSPQPSPQMRGGGMPRNVGKNPVAFPPSSSEEGAGGRFLGGSREYSRDTVEYVILPASIVVLVAALYFLNVRAIEANTRLITALQSCNSPTPDVSLFEKVIATGAYLANQETREQAISCAGGIVGNAQAPNPTKQAAFSEAMKAIQDQIAAAPKDARMYVLGGQFLSGVGDYTEGLPILETAHALTPAKQMVDFELANGYINTGATDKGLALLKAAYEEDTTYPQAQSGYAMGLVLVGREAEARAIFKDDPAIFNTEQAAQIYASPNVKAYAKAVAIYQALVDKSPTDVNLRTRLAQTEYQAGMVTAAVATLRSIEKDHPEYKDQIEAAIKSIQK